MDSQADAFVKVDMKKAAEEAEQNLMGNGIKYRGNYSPELVVRGFEEDGELVFTVKDNGIGIAKENHQKIFEIFSRLHSSSSKHEGVGMDLTIVKRIIEHKKTGTTFQHCPL